MRTFFCLVVLTVSMGLAQMALALPTLVGPTGLLIVPTAQTEAQNHYNLSAYGVEQASSLGFSLNLGFRDNLEVGFTRLSAKETIVNAKYAVQQASEGKVGVAAGLIDATDEINTTLYLVASTPFSPGDLYGVSNFQAHLGIAGGGDDDESVVALDGLFGGLSFDIADRVTLIVEHDGTAFNYGGRGKLSEKLAATVGVIGRSHDLAAQLSYTGLF